MVEKMRIRELIFAGAPAAVILVSVGVADAMAFKSPLYMRSGPGSAWPIVSSVPAGADVRIQSCASGWRHYWCRVSYGDKSGYIHAFALKEKGKQLLVAPVVTTDAADLHAQPNLFSPVQKTILGGKKVNVLHCSSGLGRSARGWCKIAYQKRIGYVRAGLLARQIH
jgi:uncharacterized protein YgiM (DUF1202 family)